MGKHFDLLCNFAESTGGASLRKLVKAARLFEIMGSAAKTDLSNEEVLLLGEDFHLPFQTICVEDVETCVLIHDIEPDSVGVSAERYVIIAGNVSSDKKFVTGAIVDDIKVVREDWLGTSIHADTIFWCKQLNGKWTQIGDWTLLQHDSNTLAGLQNDIHTNFIAAMREIIFTNSPSHFILESSPAKTRGTPKKILRSHERPAYTLLHPFDIRKKMHLPEPSENERKTCRPHERRGHFRHLKDERFTHMPDGSPRKIWIPAMWIGPVENTIGTRKYRVILD